MNGQSVSETLGGHLLYREQEKTRMKSQGPTCQGCVQGSGGPGACGEPLTALHRSHREEGNAAPVRLSGRLEATYTIQTHLPNATEAGLFTGGDQGREAVVTTLCSEPGQWGQPSLTAP